MKCDRLGAALGGGHVGEELENGRVNLKFSVNYFFDNLKLESSFGIPNCIPGQWRKGWV